MVSYNMIMPMAGLGTRFRDAGYTLPKPLIEVDGQPMFVRALESCKIPGAELNRIAFIISDVHNKRYNLAERIREHYPTAIIESLAETTEGAACTVLKMAPIFDKKGCMQQPCMIANCDQIIETSADAWQLQADGLVTCFPATHTKWSYARTEGTRIVEVAEKRAISEWATAGSYYWSTATAMFDAMQQMIDANDRTNNEFYVCPSINYNIAQGEQWHIVEVDAMHGLGTPEDLQAYVENSTQG